MDKPAPLRRRADLHGADGRHRPAAVLPRRQQHRRAGHRRAAARRRADALLPDRREGRRARAARGWSRTSTTAPCSSCTSRRPRGSPARSSSTSGWWRSEPLTTVRGDGSPGRRRTRAGRHRQRHGRRPRRRGDPRTRRRRAVPDHDVRRRAVRQLQPDHALARAGRRGDTRTTSSSTRLDWYAENDITLHAGVRVVRIDRFARRSSTPTTAPIDAVRQADHRHRQPLVHPADGRHVGRRRRRSLPGRLRVPHHRRHPRDARLRRRDSARPSSSAAACSGWRPPAGCRQHGLRGARRAVRAGPDEPAARRGGRRDPRARVLERSGIDGPHRQARPPRSCGAGRGVSGVGVRRTARALDCDMVVVTAGIRPNVDLGVVSGLTVERAIVVDDQMRTVDDPDIYAVGECAQHRGEVYGLVAPLWEQAVVLADHITGAEPERRLPRVADRDEAQGGRRRRRVDGRQGPGARRTTSSSGSPSPSAASTSRWSSATAS